MTYAWTAEVGNESVGVGSLSELRAILSRTREAACQELWLVHRDGQRICMLRSGSRAFLMFQSGDDDTGLVARAGGDAPDAATVEFTLANGQRDEYPAAWTVSAEQAVAALEHFFATAVLAPFLAWSDDSGG